MGIREILLLVAVVIFIIAAFANDRVPVDLESVGLAFFAGAFLV